ncbi:conjugal transfer protein TraN [Burkholderia cepacia]|uniref:conjugal transfer protein TraN n=1 Tax=Burkholderia cepacia TaxID=292 RepID=UPI00075D2170|nr:conjugal transfer protein TraN [Burkholderia cepacia]KWH59284.1 conjugal transfer protein TraN [Burkholderia cepacia]
MSKRILLRIVLLAAAAVAFDAVHLVHAEPTCQKISEVCVDGPSTKNISGVDVTRDCWRYTASYQCRSTDTSSDCQALRDRGCGQVSTRCLSSAADGSCITQENTFVCKTTPDQIVNQTVCDKGAFCQNGVGCFDTSAPQDKDFGQAVAMLEAAREAGVYGVNSKAVEIFKGYHETCSIKGVGGATLSNCCSSNDGGQTFVNYAMLAVGTGKALATGSHYMYDALYQNIDSTLMSKGIGAANSVTSLFTGGGFTPTFGMYGFTFSFSFSSGFTFVGFDPSSFALSVAIQLVQMWLKCNTAEQTLSLKRGQNLCVQTGTRCTKKVLGVCLEREQDHCCFNSILAKLINRQGRSQLGLPMDQCGGFSADQLTQLDFSRIDFSEFIASVAPKNPDQGGITGSVQKTVNDKVQSYYGNGQ